MDDYTYENSQLRYQPVAKTKCRSSHPSQGFASPLRALDSGCELRQRATGRGMPPAGAPGSGYFPRHATFSLEIYPLSIQEIHRRTCRHLINYRLDLTGTRWSLTGAESVLKLRSLWASKDLNGYWDFHKRREYERNHAARYVEASVS